MADVLIAGIGVENCAYSFDDLFSFEVPPALVPDVAVGKRVLVPFGRSNTLRQGFVFTLEKGAPDEGRPLKRVSSVLDAEALLTDETVKLARYLREQTFCTYFTAARAMLPGGMCLRTERVYSLPERPAPEALTIAEREVVSLLAASKKGEREGALMKKLGLGDDAVLKALLKRGVIRSETDAFGGVNALSVKMVRLTGEVPPEIPLTAKQRQVTELLETFDTATVREISYYTGCSDAVVRALVKKGICELYDAPVWRVPEGAAAAKPAKKAVLSAKQKKAYETLLAAYERGQGETALLYGVTGSGKTNVYLSLIDRVLADGKNAIVLVPEISLTSQTYTIFRERYGDEVAILHSALSLGERRDAFFRIRSGDVRVVIGTRSAVFSPLANVGVIVIDEEQAHTYKSEMAPRYDARNAARFRAAYHGALLVLASATPSVETFAKASSGAYLFCELPERYGDAVLPAVTVVDTSSKENVAPGAAISLPLANALRETLSRKEQSILLVNRRGFNTFVACQACKHVLSCPNCSISLTYHSANHRLMCHYCGYSVPFTDTCPECGDKNVRYSGFGTQRVEQELKILLPEARILRMDADTTTAKNAHEKALTAFANEQYDVLIGTQMVAKGLDFPKVSLVGIVFADSELYNDDFRSAENTFDLITQVVGRAGRAEIAGRAFIQTQAPDNEILRLAARQDYKTFFQQEFLMRKAMTYPPFCDVCEIGFSAETETLAASAAAFFMKTLERLNNEEYSRKLIALGPLAPKLMRVNRLYRQKILIKCKNEARLRALISAALRLTAAEKAYKNVSAWAVLNPESTA
ncbi:MAG: primosomal protein N' [Clostridia bacterium]|nr:primosomal protein N' [Clostridia bacterium]